MVSEVKFSQYLIMVTKEDHFHTDHKNLIISLSESSTTTMFFGEVGWRV